MQSLVIDTLRLEPNESDGSAVIRVDWIGRANLRKPAEALEPYLQMLIDSAASSGRTLELNFEPLEHFNSATILLISQLIQQAQRRGLPLRILYNAAVKWQKMTFEVLQQLDRKDGLLTIVGQRRNQPKEGGS